MSKLKINFTPILVGIFVLLGTIIFTAPAFADNLTLTCGMGGCTADPLTPLFGEGNLAPGDGVSRTVVVQNNFAGARKFAVEVVGATFADSTPPLSQVLEITIREVGTGTVLYGPKNFAEWLAGGYLVLSSIPPGGAKTYEFFVSLGDAGNDLQGKQLSFDLSLGFDTVGTVLGEETKRSEVLGVVLPATGAPLANLVLAALSFAIGLRLRRRVKRA